MIKPVSSGFPILRRGESTQTTNELSLQTAWTSAPLEGIHRGVSTDDEDKQHPEPMIEIEVKNTRQHIYPQ
jgi:hypothetical protein